MTVEPAGNTLAWRIPRTTERLALRMAWVRWFLTLVVFSLTVIFIWPSETRLIPLAMGVPLLGVLWWWLVKRTEQRLSREPNVWVDAHELRWQDNQDRLQRLSRQAVESFFVEGGEGQGPIRLRLTGGFLSQPIAVHSPVSAADVREYLQQQWNLPEQPLTSEESRGVCLGRLPIYSEMHDEDRIWHLEGDVASLIAIAGALEQAGQVPLPPTGACPAPQHIVTERREPGLVEVLVDHATMLGIESLSASPERLRELAEKMRQEMKARGTDPDWSFDWPTDDGVWTIALHVRGANAR